MSGLARLIREAKDDRDFFNELTSNPRGVIGRLDYLSDEEVAGILLVRPVELIEGIANGTIRPGSDVEVCGASCAGTCGGSCGSSCAGSCGATCAGSCESSCGATCGGSCGTSCGTSCAGSCGGSCAGSCGNSCGASCVTSCAVSGGLVGREEWAVLPAEVLQGVDATFRAGDLKIPAAITQYKRYFR